MNESINKPWIIVGKLSEIHSQLDKPLYFLENDTLWEQFRFKSFKKRNKLGTPIKNYFPDRGIICIQHCTYKIKL